MPVGRRGLRRLKTDGALRAGAVFHDDRLSQRRGELLGEPARHDVGLPARRVRRDQPDRLGGPGLREREERCESERSGDQDPGHELRVSYADDAISIARIDSTRISSVSSAL